MNWDKLGIVIIIVWAVFIPLIYMGWVVPIVPIGLTGLLFIRFGLSARRRKRS